MTVHSGPDLRFSRPVARVLHEVLGALVSPRVRGRVLDEALAGGELTVPDAGPELHELLEGPLHTALSNQVGPATADLVVDQLEIILDPILLPPTDPPQAFEGPDGPERATPVVSIRNMATPLPERSAFDDVPTVEMPAELLAHVRETVGPNATPLGRVVLLSHDEVARVRLERTAVMGESVVRADDVHDLFIAAACDRSLGQVFVLDAREGPVGRLVARRLAALPLKATVVLWGQHEMDLGGRQAVALGWIRAAAEASPEEIGELVFGLRTAAAAG